MIIHDLDYWVYDVYAAHSWNYQDRRHVRTRDEVDGRPLLPMSPILHPQSQSRNCNELLLCCCIELVTISSIWYYMYLLQLGLVFFYSAWHSFWLHETQKFRHKASEDIIANSFNLSNVCQKDISIICITFNIDYHWISLIYHDLQVSLLSTFFHMFPRFHPFSSVSLSGSSDLLILPPRPGMALGAMLSSVTFPGDRSDKMWQVSNKYQTSIKQVSNISKFTKVQVIQVIRKGCCMAASVQCIKSGVWLYWIPRNVICLLL